ncbi:30S ribosomal protein S4 [Candidatus Rhabdochlamydia porcellionis]|jgi:small subunit ribosomal protein S4|uniref:Small ribosomal subunit protein uS4 n=1 Tax=Candidatus Rhabdochlamydia porcellionis TaxID=225148 RepID=A0ABX8Z4X8_9BACT|nr:30S ribosomal protein S4 [Candidatus Rhabdochlamydia porcellionis]QZA59171.1 30S ribosomal protein S4 [Candidatus Rhabdochlamydia porcellionis]
MVRYTGPKNRVARRFGANIFGKARNPLLHKPNPPGMHGSKRKKKSDYGLQLEEQQKLKAVYGMLTTTQVVLYYEKAVQEAAKESSKEQGKNAPTLFIERLECRLDNMVYRLKLAPTIFAAQQLVSHGHVLVNGKKVDRRSFFVRPGMTISIKEKSQKNDKIQKSVISSGDIPEYLSLDAGTFSGQLLISPAIDQIPFPILINVPLICEFLAHNN